MLEVLGALGGIVLADLVLSLDNALVIGAAATGLPDRQRWLAILLGGGGAIVLRILLAAAATLLLQIPLLQAAGGVLLLLIAIRLLVDHRSPRPGGRTPPAAATSATAGFPHAGAPERKGFLAAMLTILVADVTMSLDNVLAIGALAAGHLPLLAAGLSLSIVILLLGSALVARLIERLPWLLDIAALVLGWTAASMVLHDERLGPILGNWPWTSFAVPAMTLGIALAADGFVRLRQRSGRAKATSAGELHGDHARIMDSDQKTGRTAGRRRGAEHAGYR